MDQPRTRAEQRELTKFFRALSNPTRRAILLMLDKGEQSSGDIASQFDSGLFTISRHLKVLEEANLVSRERRRNRVYYSLESDWMKATVRQFFGRL